MYKAEEHIFLATGSFGAQMMPWGNLKQQLVISELGDGGADMDIEVCVIKKNYFTNCQTFRSNFMSQALHSKQTRYAIDKCGLKLNYITRFTGSNI